MPEPTGNDWYNKAQEAETNRSYLAAIQYYQRAEKAFRATNDDEGLGDVLNSLGCCYEDGWGVDKDLAKAFEFYTTAANLGNAFACYNIAMFYQKGIHVAQSDALAVHWFEQAAHQGDDEAPHVLFVSHFFCVGVKNNAGKLKHWFEKAWGLEVEDKRNIIMARLETKTIEAATFEQRYFEIAYHWFMLREDQGNMLLLLKKDPRNWYLMFEHEEHRLFKSPEDRGFMREFILNDNVVKFFQEKPQHADIAKAIHLHLAQCFLEVGATDNDQDDLAIAQEHLMRGTAKATRSLLTRSYQNQGVDSATQTCEGELTREEKRKFHFFG